MLHSKISSSKNKFIQHYYTHGKLLLTAEYAVLDGATAFALPTSRGQYLSVFPHYTRTNELHWRSLGHDDHCWFEGRLNLADLTIIEASDQGIGQRLQDFLRAIDQQVPGFFNDKKGHLIQTRLEFPRHWGLGSSSTLVSSLARWAGIDPYQLLADTLGGSGYDLACAEAESPILYTREDGRPIATTCLFDPSFKDQLYFVYLEQKQNSREGIQRYREMGQHKEQLIKTTTAITHQILKAKNLKEFCHLIDQHETLIADSLQLSKVKELYFEDFLGSIKSLGAWGGDFVLVAKAGPVETIRQYFSEKGYPIFLSYADMILQ